MTVPEIVRDLLDGKAFDRNLGRLRARRREAILHLLAVLGGEADYTFGPGVHPIDALDTAHAALSLLGAGDPDFVIELLQDALRSPAYHPARPLALAVADLGTAKTVEPLMEAIRHRDEWVRDAACDGLRRARARRALPSLNRAALDRSSTVRSSAVRALKTLGDRTSLPFLKRRLRDRYPGIRTAALEAIKAIEKRTP
jgi:HEAT repeat protein